MSWQTVIKESLWKTYSNIELPIDVVLEGLKESLFARAYLSSKEKRLAREEKPATTIDSITSSSNSQCPVVDLKASEGGDLVLLLSIPIYTTSTIYKFNLTQIPIDPILALQTAQRDIEETVDSLVEITEPLTYTGSIHLQGKNPQEVDPWPQGVERAITWSILLNDLPSVFSMGEHNQSLVVNKAGLYKVRHNVRQLANIWGGSGEYTELINGGYFVRSLKKGDMICRFLGDNFRGSLFHLTATFLKQAFP